MIRAVVQTEPGVLALNFMWLPAFLAYDRALAQRIGALLSKEVVGALATDALLDELHHRVVDIICAHHASVHGLRDYLDAMKFVEGPRA